MYLVRKFYCPDPEEKGGAPSKEEGKQQPSGKEPEETSNVALAKALKEARENTVSVEEYNKLQEENRKLVSEIINGEGGAGNGQQATPEKVSIEELRKILYGPQASELSNLDFCKHTLELRDAVIAQEGYDPFLPHGAKIKPTEQDIERADLVAKTIKDCIEKSEGNSEVFTALLQAEITNDTPTFTAHLKKLGLIK